ncbi:hypothetical protein MN116_007242 [Schistosoma mekongi]|uniref:Uncharacterized protein n=1 Tax=Schistosoma mekongi TaxID=38744 RepID=A0AAE2D340_SCHME|nr:hypothetical protein MN116_007242 [Schistosoma mekongi]
MIKESIPKPLLPTRIARLEQLIVNKKTYLLQQEKLTNYILNSYGFYKKQEKLPFDIWNMDNQAILHLYRSGIKHRRQLHVRSAKYTSWRPISVRKSAKRTTYAYKPQSGNIVTSSVKPEITDQTDSSTNIEPIKRIQSLAESVRDESISLDEVQPELHIISQEMVNGIIDGGEEKSSTFMKILEQHQQPVVDVGDEVESNVLDTNYVEQISRRSSVLSDTSGKELAEAFLNNLTDNISIYLEDILDDLLQNDNNDLQFETNHSN